MQAIQVFKQYKNGSGDAVSTQAQIRLDYIDKLDIIQASIQVAKADAANADHGEG